MNLADIRARMRRLEVLVNGLGREESLWRECSAPVLAVDRLEYMAAINEARLRTTSFAMASVIPRRRPRL